MHSLVTTLSIHSPIILIKTGIYLLTTPHLFNSLGVVVEPKSITGIMTDCISKTESSI